MKTIETFLNLLQLGARRFLPVIFIFSSIQIGVRGQNNQTITIGSIEAKSGEKVTGKIIVEEGVDQGTFIPVTIVNGTKTGSVLTLLAGIHGTEYVPVVALQKMAQEISPEELSGTLILVHIANTLSFSGRSVYSTPVDDKNLNRIFPGNQNGTVSERIAMTITNEIIKKSDYYIDLHGGEFNERVVDYVYFYYGCPDQELNRKSRMLAHPIGNKYLIPFDYNWIPDSVPSQYSDFEALRQGAAAITLEWGERGIVSMEEVEKARKSLINVMRKIGMLEGKAIINEHPVYLLNENSVKSNYDGILYTLVDKEQFVSKGTLMGYTTDYWGNILEKYHSPITGIVMATKVSPAIKKGEVVCNVAQASEKFEE